jgi:hypothetical protein
MVINAGETYIPAASCQRVEGGGTEFSAGHYGHPGQTQRLAGQVMDAGFVDFLPEGEGESV